MLVKPSFAVVHSGLVKEKDEDCNPKALGWEQRRHIITNGKKEKLMWHIIRKEETITKIADAEGMNLSILYC